MATTAAIFHHPDAVESADRPLAGRRAAGQSFLQGLVRHSRADRLHCVADSQAHLAHFRGLLQEFGWAGGIDGSLTHEPQKLAGAGALMLPGPSLSSHAWIRRRAGQGLYSLCGITHTVATRRIMDGLFELLTAPIEPWDAIICTSHAVQSVVAEQSDRTEAYLARRFAARRVPRPQLPVIPLGIDSTRFARNDAERVRWRERFQVPGDGVVVMSMGRLSVFEKMHPAPLMLSLQLAAEQTQSPLTLLMAGWFGNDESERIHRDAARQLAPSVSVHFPDGKDAEVRSGLWSAADIFALPVDNIQETFGLAPLEAMAAGLPVVCSDWDGFKDTVEDGVTGHRVRTLMAPPGSGQALAERFETGSDGYLQYLGFVQQHTVVDVREMADAFGALVANPQRRRQMGEAGRARVARMFDWAAVIPQYQALWSELAARRARETATTPREGSEPANPAALDPFSLYRRYPTCSLPRHARLSADRAVYEVEIDALLALTGATYLKRMVARLETIAAVQAAVFRLGPVTPGKLEAEVAAPRGSIEGAVLWLAKYDLIRIET